MLKILIVDDDLEVLKSLGDTFTTVLRGFLVLTATSANQGLNMIKQQKPDVIIMDVRLGPLSGMDLLEDYSRHMKDYNPGLIVITAYDDEKVREKAKLLGVDAFLLKPFTREALLPAVFDAIEKKLEAQLKWLRFTAQAFRGKSEDVDRTKKVLTEDPGNQG